MNVEDKDQVARKEVRASSRVVSCEVLAAVVEMAVGEVRTAEEVESVRVVEADIVDDQVDDN